MHSARIGPNSVTRVAEALRVYAGNAVMLEVFASAGLSNYIEHPPHQMVDETEVARLHEMLRTTLGVREARRISGVAGARTGQYLLDRRIPHPIQWLLRRLPAPIAAHILSTAIRRHAWTFTGSGSLVAHAGRSVRLEISDNPLCHLVRHNEPVCDYLTATFETLFRELVHHRARASEVACMADGATRCVFEVTWRSDHR